MFKQCSLEYSLGLLSSSFPAAHPHSFQAFFSHENASIKGTFNVFFIIVAKSSPVLSADLVVRWCQEGIVLVY